MKGCGHRIVCRVTATSDAAVAASRLPAIVAVPVTFAVEPRASGVVPRMTVTFVLATIGLPDFGGSGAHLIALAESTGAT